MFYQLPINGSFGCLFVRHSRSWTGPTRIREQSLHHNLAWTRGEGDGMEDVQLAWRRWCWGQQGRWQSRRTKEGKMISETINEVSDVVSSWRRQLRLGWRASSGHCLWEGKVVSNHSSVLLSFLFRIWSGWGRGRRRKGYALTNTTSVDTLPIGTSLGDALAVTSFELTSEQVSESMKIHFRQRNTYRYWK